MTTKTRPDKTPESGSRLTVCFPVNYLGFGGAERQLIDLVNGLDKRVFNAVVVTIFPGGPLEDELVDSPGVTLVSLDRGSKYSPAAFLKMARVLRRHRVDIVQPFLTPATLYGIGGSLIARTPVRIVTERCGLRQGRHLGNRLYRLLEDRLTRFADAVVPNSEAGSSYVNGRGIAARKTTVIYNGINKARLEPDAGRVAEVRRRLGVLEGGVVIGNIASLTGPKDQATLLNAVATLAPRYPGLRAAFVGDGNLRADLERLSANLGLEDRVTFFGHQRRVADFLGAMDIAVLSSRDNEGCSNFLLEAMTMGLPSVATDVGGNREVIEPGKSGILAGVGDAGAIAGAIARLIDEPQIRTRMGLDARRIADERFSMQAMVGAYERLYLRLAEAKRVISPDRLAV